MTNVETDEPGLLKMFVSVRFYNPGGAPQKQ